MPELTRTFPGLALRPLGMVMFVDHDDIVQPRVTIHPPDHSEFPVYDAKVTVKEELRPTSFQVKPGEEEMCEVVITLQVPRSKVILT